MGEDEVAERAQVAGLPLLDLPLRAVDAALRTVARLVRGAEQRETVSSRRDA